MLIDSRISTYRVPAAVWRDGYQGKPSLPPMALPAGDALDIDRRAVKGVRLGQESRRYSLCCERIQQIARELAAVGALPDPHVWPSQHREEDGTPTARALLALTEYVPGFFKKGNVAASFFPPDHVSIYAKVLAHVLAVPTLHDHMKSAAHAFSIPGDEWVISPDDVHAALRVRQQILAQAASEGAAVVDVVDIIVL